MLSTETHLTVDDFRRKYLNALRPVVLKQGVADWPAVGKWDLDFLLTGSLRRGDANLRVGVQLIRVQGRETVWAERFDVPLENTLALLEVVSSQ